MSKYILIADMHLRYDTPVSRTDDFIQAQIKKLQWLSALQKEHNATILNSGDIFHKARPDNGNELLNEIIFPSLPKMVGIAGNHDLLYHKMENLDKSIIGVIIKGGLYNLIKKEWNTVDDNIFPFHFGNNIEHREKNTEGKTIAIYHGYVSKEKGIISGKTAKSLLKEFPEYDLIFTGDNHETFTEEYEGRYLVNPGCFTRQTADKMEHKPCVFMYDSEKHTIEQHFIPIEKDVFSIAHLEKQKEKDQRLNSFIETVNGTYEVGGSFKNNMDNYYKENETDNEVKSIIAECMEEIKA